MTREAKELPKVPLDLDLKPKTNPSRRVAYLGQVAEYLQCSTLTIRRRIAHEGLPARRLGRRWIFDLDQVDGWLNRLPGANIPQAS